MLIQLGWADRLRPDVGLAAEDGLPAESPKIQASRPRGPNQLVGEHRRKQQADAERDHQADQQR